ncbi:hypothetical protein P7C70_g2517, partial [Phenoliferia sp. Uapishka_3]
MTSIPPPSLSVPALLPILFSPHPTPLPVHLLSPTTHLSHTFLSTSPSSPSYLQLLPSPALTSLYNRTVERGFPDLQVGPDIWTIEEGGVRGRVEIHRAGEDTDDKQALAVDLVWEAGGREDDDEGPRWLFVTLSLAERGVIPRGWHTTLSAARSAELPRPASTPSLEDFLPPSIAIPRGPPKTTAEMAEGEGTTPGAYGAAEDFWDGWSEDAEEDGMEREAFVRQVEQEEREDREHDEDERDGYWDSYGGVESAVGEVDNGAEEEEHTPPKKPRSITRSRRSSTIRAPAVVTPPPGLVSNPVSTYFQPLPSSSYLSPEVHALTPSPMLVPIPSSNTPLASPGLVVQSNGAVKSSNGFELPAPVEEAKTPKAVADDEEALQFALAGVWRLYSNGATWDELERKKERWDRVARMVSRA